MGRDEESRRAVLVVDDDQVFLNTCRRTVSRNVDIYIASSIREAIGLASKVRISIAFIDCFLGEENGIDLIRAIRRHAPAARLLLTSGLMSYPIATAAMRAGADDVVLKPFAITDMLHAIENVVEAPQREVMSLNRMTWEFIQRTVHECDGNLSEAARLLGIDRNTIRRRLTRSPSKE